MDAFRKKVKARVAEGGVLLAIGALLLAEIFLFGERLPQAEGPESLRDFAQGFGFGSHANPPVRIFTLSLYTDMVGLDDSRRIVCFNKGEVSRQAQNNSDLRCRVWPRIRIAWLFMELCFLSCVF